MLVINLKLKNAINTIKHKLKDDLKTNKKITNKKSLLVKNFSMRNKLFLKTIHVYMGAHRMNEKLRSYAITSFSTKELSIVYNTL